MSDRFTARVQIADDRWLAFSDPALILQADSPQAVRRTLSDVEQITRDRALHAVGFVSFDAAAAFDLAVTPAPASGDRIPLAWFAFYDAAHVSESGPPEGSGTYSLGALTPTVDREAFAEAFHRIKAHLQAGDTYQVNYTFQLRGSFEGDAFALFADLCRSQRGGYGAYIDLGDTVVCSASPELFFEFRGAEIFAKPMKGTARRGRTLDEDRAAGVELAGSPKNRAENVMVVDMIRNDLGRIAEVGTVEVPQLFQVERYPNVWQMTSLVKARSMAPLDDVFAALHPSASITGAPKVRTMELLAGLESTSRGIYTGAIGHVPPDGLARFNVAIRTAVVDRASGTLSFGIGSGIVWDSQVDAEYDECLAKASILGHRPAVFDLLETFRWSPGEGYFLHDRHMDRLRASAEYFDVPVDDARIESALDAAVAGATLAMRVRLLVASDGVPRAEAQPHVPTDRILKVSLASEPVDASDIFLFHKTTNRGVYERARASAPDVDDVLLWNGAGQITEATTANVIVEVDGHRVTPPIDCGLLPGTCRASMLAAGEISERVVTVEELRRATRIWIVNAVHGAREATLVSRA